MDKSKGKLYLIPSSLGNSKLNSIIPEYNSKIINRLDEFIVENIRTARRFLKKTGFKKSFDNITFYILDKHSDQTEILSYLNSIDKGKDIGLLSEAGTPCIADPGAEIVRMAHQKNIRVIPLVGPSSIFLALMASGFNGQNFVFHGYLPIKKYLKINKIKTLEKDAQQKNQTQIFIETPYRNKQLLDSIIETCNKETLLCIACDITLKNEFITTKTIAEWSKNLPEIHKRPTVFLLY
ncbi:MAG: SAM-dependent methyltransferase [Bacteroidales bacterium]|nr:SAM-dependent methyltransferase [Bacteroidales bacterium]